MSDITWTNERRKLSELIPWPDNPRQIKADQAERLRQSLDEFAQVETLAIGPDNELYNGHQRLKVWADAYGDITVDVRVSSRPLDEQERKKLAIFLEKAKGEWDFDVMANAFDVDDLLEWGFSEAELEMNEVYVPDFQPVDESEQPRLDQKAPIECPECGAEFVPK